MFPTIPTTYDEALALPAFKSLPAKAN